MFQYFFAVMFLLAALGSIIDPPEYVLGIVFLGIGLLLLPPFRSFLKNNSRNIKIPAISSKRRELRKDVEAALEDGVLTDEEARHLEARADELGIKQDFITKLRTKDFNGRIQPILDEITETRRFSPDQETELKQIASDLQVDVRYENEFKMYRDLWHYENDGKFEFVPISPSIMLKSNEEAYFETPCVWKQLKVVRNYKGYVGGSVGFRVAKGVNFRVGRAVPVYDEAEEMVPISGGEIHITNKRITFNGDRKSTNITTGRIVQLLMWGNGIEIRKTSGKPDFFEMNPIDAEYISALVHNIMNK